MSEYKHPTSIEEFEKVYAEEYRQELQSAERWINWCRNRNPPDTHGINFYQGLRSALIFTDIKMGQLLRILKREAPNV